MTITSRFPAAAAVLVAVLALTGCGGSDSPSAAGSTAPAGSRSAPSEGPSGSTSLPIPGITPGKNPDGTAIEPRSLPDGFPVDEIPVAKGDVIDGAPGDAGGPVAFTLLISVSGTSPATAMDRITAQLKGVGFTAAPGVGTSKTATSTFTNATYDVGVNVIKADGRLTASYVVVRKSG